MFGKVIAGAVTACMCAGGAFNWIDFQSNVVLSLFMVAGSLSAIILGSLVTVFMHIKLSPPHIIKAKMPNEVLALQTLAATINCNAKNKPNNLQGIVVSRKTDAALASMIQCFIDNNILPWYGNLVDNPEPSINTLKNILWYAIISLHDRLSKVDHVRFVMCGFVTCLTHHLEKIRVAEAAGEAIGERGVFHLAPQLCSPVRERNFLRLVAEFLIIKSLPPEYHKCTALRTLVKEIIACRLLEPMIDRICDPHWINQHLAQYLRQQHAAEELGRRTCHAASYEDFITLIHDSTDISDLKHLRRNIINEIMQATAISNLKKAKGVDLHREAATGPLGAAKGDLMQAKNLKKYITQLTYAKAQCERRINLLKNRNINDGVNSSKAILEESTDTITELFDDDMFLISKTKESLSSRKILVFQAIIECAFARRYFAIYLDEIGQGSMLSFWTAVQELRQADRKLHYQLGVEIYYTYLASHSAPVKIDKVCLRGVEAFLLGNRGPEVLFEIAEEIERNLEDRFYPGFLISSTYNAMLKQAALQGIDFITPVEADESVDKSTVDSGNTDSSEVPRLQLSDHSTYAKNKLAHLQEKLSNKLLALQAIQQTKKADAKVILHLDTEITNLRSDHKLLEAHVERTAYWSDFIGHWRVFVQTVQIPQEKEVPNFILLVHRDSDSVHDETPSEDESPSVPSVGWVVIRKLNQLVDLHRKLCQIVPSIKAFELPSSQPKLLFNKQLDKAYLDKIHTASQNFFNAIMMDEKLSGSELIYAFLSPSPEHLKQPDCPPKKSKFSFSTFFKGSDGKNDCDDEEIGNLILMDSSQNDQIAETVDATVKDSIAEPIFAFLEELCELRGVSKWLRKTLISFVQITYGKNITRHVRETVQGLLSESMVIYYLQTMENSLWPEGGLTHQQEAQKTQEDIARTRNEAHDLFVRNLPELLCTLVGQQNARKGATRLFCTLQHHALNKNLFYTLLEVMLQEFFPELQDRLKTKA